MNILKNLNEILDDRSAIIGIIGLGYVGLPLMLAFAKAGYPVVGLDSDAEKLKKLKSGQSYLKHIDAGIVGGLKGKFTATRKFSKLGKCDAIIICLPTPLDEHNAPDLSFVTGAVASLLPHLRRGQIISLESTTWPGTTEEILLPQIESVGLNVGSDLALVFSPEREDPGNKQYFTHNIPKIVGGVTESCLQLGLALYGQVIEKLVPVSSPRVAELTKLYENIHRAVNIGLVNEIKMISDKMDVDIFEVIQAASTKPFGFVTYWPGPGLGGHCIPIDPFYLSWKAREYGVSAKFIELAGEINSYMPTWVVGKLQEALNGVCKSVNGANIIIVGLAYKKNLDDTRESPALVLIDNLIRLGGLVTYYDPYLPTFPKTRKYHFNLQCVSLTPETLQACDCVLIATDHDSVDYELIQKHARLIVDTRFVYPSGTRNVVRA